MNSVIQLLVLFVVATSCFAQTQVTEMKSLVGRKAVAERMPFYQPGTYQQIPNTYAGQTVTIIDVKPSAMFAAMPKLTEREMASLPSVITSKAANGYHFKTGQRKWPSRTENVLPCRLLWWQVGFGAPASGAALEHVAVVQ
jgi:hypothetical protein